MTRSTDGRKKTPGKIAILREAGGLGDVVMTEPVVKRLAEKYPNTKIHYACLPEYRETVSVFSRPPDVFHAVERHLRRHRDATPDTNRWPYLKDIIEDADIVVDLFCPAYIHERRHASHTHKSRVELFCEAAEVKFSAPQLRIPENEIEWARGFLAARGWWGKEHGELIGLAPWSCGLRRTWPKRKWRSLARRLTSSGKTPLVFHVFDEPVSDITGIRATGLPLPKVAALLTLCAKLVANDSGLLHMAAACNVPTVSLWGSTNPMVTLEGYTRAEFIYKPDSSVRPKGCNAPCYSMKGFCDLPACRKSCLILDDITVKEVEDKL